MADMEKLLSQLKSDSEASKVLKDKDKLKDLLTSEDGKKLMAILNKDGGSALKKAAEALTTGDSDQARRILEPIMNQPEASKLVDELNKKANK